MKTYILNTKETMRADVECAFSLWLLFKLHLLFCDLSFLIYFMLLAYLTVKIIFMFKKIRPKLSTAHIKHY